VACGVPVIFPVVVLKVNPLGNTAEVPVPAYFKA